MENPQPRAQILALMMGCMVGEEDLRTRVTKRKEVDMSWNGFVSPIIQGRMKKDEYNRLSQGGPGEVLRLSVALLTGRGSAPMRSRGSR
jgi:hypothetical protein